MVLVSECVLCDLVWWGVGGGGKRRPVETRLSSVNDSLSFSPVEGVGVGLGNTVGGGADLERGNGSVIIRLLD